MKKLLTFISLMAINSILFSTAANMQISPMLPVTMSSDFGSDFLNLITQLAPYTNDLRIKLQNSSVEHMQLAAREIVQTAPDAAVAIQDFYPTLAQAINKYADQLQTDMVDRINEIPQKIYFMKPVEFNYGEQFTDLLPKLAPFEKDPRVHMFVCGLYHFQLYAREILRTAPDAIIALQSQNKNLAQTVKTHAQKVYNKIVGPISKIPQDFTLKAPSLKIDNFNLGQSFITLSQQIHPFESDVRIHLFEYALRNVQLASLEAIQTAQEAANALQKSNPSLSKAILDHANQLYAAINERIANSPALV